MRLSLPLVNVAGYECSDSVRHDHRPCDGSEWRRSSGRGRHGNERRTHEASSTRTTDTGLYTVPYLETGAYSVSVTKAGFETVTVNGLLLNPGATAKVDVRLKLGPTATNVQVDAAIQQLQTESSTVSAGVGALAIENIPNITENPLYHTTLENNVQPRLCDHAH